MTHLDFSGCILLCILVVFVGVGSGRSTERGAPGLQALEGKSFALRSSVNIINMEVSSNRPANSWSKIYESYSTEQQRAKLVFRNVGPQPNFKQGLELGTFYYDAKSDKVLLHKLLKTSCVESNKSIIKEKFAIDFLEDLELEQVVTDDHIVGPARLLFYVAKHQDKLELRSLSEPVFVRNIPTLVYSMNVTARSYKKPVKFSVYYGESTAFRQDQSLPLQIIIQTDKQITIFDYSQLEFLIPNTAQSQSDHLVLKSGTMLDPFAFPLQSGCSKSIAGQDSVQLFKDKAANFVKFSFRGQSNFIVMMDAAPLNVKMNKFVAYDGASNSLRVDIPIPTPKKSGVQRQIFNFKLNRMYHSVERVTGSDTFLDKTLDLSKASAGPEDWDAISETTQCMVARMFPAEQAEKSITLGKLLVGSEEFVYMGKAQVRGMPALVYEASNASMPFWLDQPMEYKQADQSKVRRPEKGARETSDTSSSLTNVIYLAEQEDDHPLLLIEVSSFNLEKQAVVVHDFAWNLAHQAPNGDRATELFSLEDFCSAGLGRNHYSRVDMMLEPQIDNNEPSNFITMLNNSLTRNLALLASLQRDIKIPATMIYDLESKLMAPPTINGMSQIQQPTLMASFRVAKHVDKLAELVYLGQGRFNVLYSGSRTSVFCRSFQACFFLAAHRRANVYFAYNLDKRICSIDSDPIIGPNQVVDEHPPSFTMDPEETMEIFRISHVVDPIMATSLNTWMEENLKFEQRFRLIGKTMSLSYDYDKFSMFKIKTIRLDDRDYKASLAVDSEKLDDSNKSQFKTNLFAGFGLSETEPQNKRVAPVSLQTANWSPLTSYLDDSSSTMTYEQCHAACLSDQDCQSFSLCVRNMEAQCVSSKVSFRSPQVAKQLANLTYSASNSRTKASKQVQITLDDNGSQTPIKLIQHMNCDLYSKVYLDLYDKPSETKQTFTNRRVYAVNSQEECAQLCFKRNIDVLGDDLSRASDSYSVFAEASSLSPTKDHETLLNLLELDRRSNLQFCRAFLYWDRVELELRGKGFAESVRSRVIEADKVDFDSIDGYCTLGDRLSKLEEEELIRANKHDPHASNDYSPAQLYSFKTEIFYEKQHGVRLKRSSLDLKEHRAYRMAKRGSPEADEETYGLLRALILMGDNFQDKLHADVSKCAQICFLQSWGPWPACRSFSIAIESENNRTVTNCYLNSITMHQAISTQRSDLIDETTKAQLWHYEPRPGFGAEKGKLSESLQWIETDLWLSSKKTLHTMIGSVGAFFIFLLALGSGLMLGLHLGPALIQKIRQRRRDISDKEILVRRQTIIEFSNQVTADGLIQGE